MSEPNAGSDLASLVTSAVRDGDEFVINGQKIWTSFGAVADYIYLICRTSNDGPPHEGISEIIVPMTHARHRGPADQGHDDQPPLLRGVLHRRPRAGRATSSVSRARRSSRRWASSSTSGAASTGWCRTTPCTGWPSSAPTRRIRLVRQQIAALETGYRIGRILVVREVLRQAPRGFSAATKCFCTEHEWRVAEFVSQTFGAEATCGTTSCTACSTRPATRSWVARRTSCATSSASACSVCRARTG